MLRFIGLALLSAIRKRLTEPNYLRASLAYFTLCFSNFLARVRRCRPRRLAVSEILKPVAARVSWMCSYSTVLIEVVCSVNSTSASPWAWVKAASMSSVLAGLAC